MRRLVLMYALIVLGLFSLNRLRAAEPLPVGAHPPAVGMPHFPDRLHAFVWRNWGLVQTDRLAGVVGTTPANIAKMAVSMGLPSVGSTVPRMQKRGYITILRRNWHLLPYDQILTLLDMTADQLRVSLREDDFLFHKLGNLKPKCEPLRYHAPGPQARKRAAEIRRVVERNFGKQLAAPAEPRFHFVEQLGTVSHALPKHLRPAGLRPSVKGLRYVYSYFGSFGDPLIDPKLDPYPDGLLQKLADVGVNGVWLHIVLRQLAPGGTAFPEFGAGHEQRLANLRRLVNRAKRYGIGVYLYINEPRAMPVSFFRNRHEMAGVREGNFIAMCTSNATVRRWLEDSLAHVFSKVPDLAGVFTITASENLTNCASHGRRQGCPRCKLRSEAEIIAEVNAVIEKGVHRGNPRANVIAWDWGWNHHGDAPETIARLPKKVALMSVSEWALPINRGGVRGKIGEYSISAVGPGPRATRHWSLAKQAGLQTVAKVQFNNTWEYSAIPWLPVLDLIAEHSARLSKAGVDGVMLSWSLGGYPSPNLRVAQRFWTQPGADKKTVLNAIARERYGSAAVPSARRAWALFSKAFRNFPYNGSVLYRGPQQRGPANLLYGQPTGYRSTMLGFPYDDVAGWRGSYPPEVLADLFDKVAGGWADGVGQLEQVVKTADADKRPTAARDLGLARAAYLSFASSADQVRFVLARDALRRGGLSAQQKQTLHAQIQTLLDREITFARQLFVLTRRDSRIGFEASNQYYYVPQDLIEKVINCESLSRTLGTRE